MNPASLRPPINLQPRPKAVPTFSSSSAGAISRSTTPQLSRPSSRSRHPSPVRTTTPTPTDDSEKATAALIRRVLCSHMHGTAGKESPIHELLPPLTSSNDFDLQLYAIVAIIVKDLVHSWYGKITTDQSFVEEVVTIVAHCTRALESRLRQIDLESLILDEIPVLVETHINAFRVAHAAAQSQQSLTDSKLIYHNLNIHPALGPVPNPDDPSTIEEQAKNEASYRQMLAQSALAVLLPTEDLENACLRTLVGDVIAEPVLGNSIGGKVCEGWFIWNSITKIVRVIKTKTEPLSTGEDIEADTRSRLERFGLLAEDAKIKAHHRVTARPAFSSIFWRIFQYGYLMLVATRLILVGFFAAQSAPLRSSTVPKAAKSPNSSPTISHFDSNFKPRSILEFRIFPLSSMLIDLSHRMPWLSGMLALVRHHLTHGSLRTVGGTDGILDQYLHYLLQTHLPPSRLLPKLLSLARQTLFPGNSLPPPAPPSPTPEQVQQNKRQCAEAVISLLPPIMCRRLLGPSEEHWVTEVEVELEVWENGWMNKHLGYRIIELIAVRVMPELGDKGVKQLMEARLGVQQ